MDDNSDYELLPHEKLEMLRREIAQLKKQGMQHIPAEDELSAAVDRLTATMNKLITILANANDEMIDQFSQTTFVQQFNKLTAQQEQLAEGMVQISRMVQQMQAPRPAPRPVQQPPMMPTQDVAMQPPMQQQMNQPPVQQFEPAQQSQMQQPPSGPVMPNPFAPPLQQAPQPEPSPNAVNAQPPPSPLDLPPPPEHKKGLFRFGK